MQLEAIEPVPDGIDRQLGTPLFRQIADSYEAAIASGVLAPGERLESENELAARLGVSRPTVRQAFQELVDKGLVTRRQGFGTVVASDDDLPSSAHARRISLAVPVAGRLHANDTRARGSEALIGVTVPDLSNPFFAGLVQAIERAARRRNLLLVVTDTEEDPMLELRAIATMGGSVSRLLLIAPRSDDEDLAGVLSDDHKAVLINRKLHDRPRVHADIWPGISQAMGHLRALGHSRIGYVGGPEGSRMSKDIREALESSAEEFGCEVETLSRIPATHAGGYAVGDIVIASGVTAVVAHNDLIALGIISRLAERGVRVPQDVSVIGCDDIPFASLGSPSLTSIAIDRAAMGRLGVEMLCDDAEPGSVITVPSHLVVRASTGLCRELMGA